MNIEKVMIQEIEFQISKLSAMKQFHITRRIAPLLSDLIPVAKSVNKNDIENMSEDERLDHVAKVITPVMDGLSKLNDKDAEFVLYSLLSCVEMKQKEYGSWVKISNGDNLQIQNLELPLLLQVAGHAFMFNLKGFFGGLPKLSQ